MIILDEFVTRDPNVIAENETTTRGNEATEEDKLCHLPREVFPGLFTGSHAHRHQNRYRSKTESDELLNVVALTREGRRTSIYRGRM